MTINRSDAWTAAINLVLAVGLFIATPGQVETPPTILGMASGDMAPTVFPRVVTAIWALISLWNLVLSFRGARPSSIGKSGLSGAALKALVVTLGTAVLYALLLVPLGFVLSSVLTIVGLSIYYGSRSPGRIALAAFVVPGVMYVVFTRLLLVSLPPFPFLGLGF